ncbi:MAG: MBL fold metallo-hydrolase [Clostridia bacterium]|nr:MBL fold metallo-hydrolase [Clostridia bacterium]
MSKHSPRRKLFALIVSILTVGTALAYLYYGDELAKAFRELASIHYSSIASVYNDAVDEGELEVHIIDVGQGDSTLIRSADGNILIDAGTNASEAVLKAHLDACGVKAIDYLICTHPHEDHIGGADMIIDNYNVKNVLITDLRSSDSSFTALLDRIVKSDTFAAIPNTGDVYTLGDISFTVLGPLDTYEDENDMSLIIRLTFGDTTFLFTGDAGYPAERDLIERYSVDELNCDFYKIAHHGSNTSSSKELLELITPEIAAVSAGKDNEYGHPRGEVLIRLAEAGCATVLRTDTMGTVIVKSDGKVLTEGARQTQ